jgi:hypothetical protein
VEGEGSGDALDTPGNGKGKEKVRMKVLPQVKLDKPHPAPLKWREQYALIERMRKGIIAPVDDM